MAKQETPPNKRTGIPSFPTESREADWWASEEGRAFAREKSRETRMAGAPMQGSRLVGALQKRKSVQIALRISHDDMAVARELAERKGIGYQTLLKMLIHEGLERESPRY